jgi:hypothetical protein
VLRRIAALLLVSALAAPLGAEPDAPLDLSGARILASPGWPQALRAFLPPGREVEPLTLPLPPGPVLVLGLFDRDAVAREVGATTFGLNPREDLAGGYVVVAKRDGDRPLAAILAADAAALMAARFELETFVPAGKEKEPRSVEVGQPDEQAGVRTAPGRRQVRPRFRIRAAAGLGPGESVLDIAAAHANRFWVNDKTTDRELAQLRDHGVEPVVLTSLHAILLPEALLAWQKRGIRHFVVDLRLPGGVQGGKETGPEELLDVQEVAGVLRAGGLAELLVLPSAFDDLSAAESAPPDLRKIPEAHIGWAGPNKDPLQITRAQAELRVKTAGVPVVLMETWMEACAGEPLRIPSMPHGRSEDLGDVLAGVVVLPGPGSADALAAAWAPPSDPDASPELGELMGACVLNAKDGPTFLIESAACLEQMLLGRYADSPWMRGLPQRLRESAATLPPPERTLLARFTTDAFVFDGRLEEPAWKSAPPQALALRPARAGEVVELRGLSDGRRLMLGLRFPTSFGVTRCAWILDPEADHRQTKAFFDLPVNETTQPEKIRVRSSQRGGITEIEMLFERSALWGEPYPTRRFGLMLGVVGTGVEASFPAEEQPPEAALLVVR